MERDTNEFRVGGPNGVVKALYVKRLPRDQQWDAKMVLDLVGVPWDPRGLHGRGGAAVLDGDGGPPEKVAMPAEDEPDEGLPADDGRDVRFDSRVNAVVRNVPLRIADFQDTSYTDGCRGCASLRQGNRQV